MLRIHQILLLAYLSIRINGSSHVFFQYGRGVRQRDPLSPILFCIPEDVLSRGITRLVLGGILLLISSYRGISTNSHDFYVDDLIIFCKSNLKGLVALMELFEAYNEVSG